MRTVTGKVVVVQENRFRLVTDDGQAFLFMLAHNAPIEAQDLPPLQRDQARVRVDYTPARDRVAGIAHHLTDAGPQGARR